MNVQTDANWLLSRLFWILIAEIGFANGQRVLGIALFFITIQRSLHEFAHAITVWLSGGTIDKIMLGPGRLQMIEFTASSELSRSIIYLSGFAFDVAVAGGTGIMLISSGIWSYIILGYGLLAIMLYFCVVPEQSDFNMWTDSLSFA